jgi:MFS family permease
VTVALLCLATLVILTLAFGLTLAPPAQFALILLGGFCATCTVGPAAAIVFDVIHPGVRATGASVLSLFQNLFGLAAGPFIAGLLSDTWGLKAALAAMPAFSALAAVAFLIASRSYAAERTLARQVPAVIAPASA